MHISDIKDLTSFLTDNFGRDYYSVGPIQPNRGPIEKWKYSHDPYDSARLLLGNFFFTEDEAKDYLKFILSYKPK